MAYTNPVSATVETLMKQAPMTAQKYLRDALEGIDAALGQGEAKKNLQLVGVFMQVCAIDFATSVLSQTLQQGAAPTEF